MHDTLTVLRKEHTDLLEAAERNMADAGAEGVTSERKDELFAEATRNVEEAEKLETRIKTAMSAERMRARTDEIERASAPRPAVSGPAVTRSAIDDMTADEVATRSRLVTEKLAVHERSFTDEEKSLVDRMPLAEQVAALRLVGEASPASPAYKAWRKMEQDIATRAVADTVFNPAQNIGVDADGGNLVPVAWYSDIISERKDDGILFSNSVVNLVTKQREAGTLTIAFEDDTKDWELIPIAEATAVDSQKAGFSNKTVDVSKYYRRSALSWELTQDSPFAVRSFLTEKMGDAVARGASKLFATGAGTPPALQGLLPALPTAGAIKSGGNTSMLDINECLDVVAKVDQAYLTGGRIYFMMHRMQAVSLRKETSANLRAWSDADMTNGIPAMLHGYRVLYNSDFPAAATANAKLVVFGDFGQYWGVVDGTPRMISEYRSGTDQYVITLYIRLGGQLIDPKGLGLGISAA